MIPRCPDTDKIIHAFREMAYLAALRDRSRGRNVEEYFCHHCWQWHVGHRPREPKRLSKSQIREALRELTSRTPEVKPWSRSRTQRLRKQQRRKEE
jgi:hypothetical protein